MHDNTVAIAFYLIHMLANQVADYRNTVVTHDNTVAIAFYLICMPDNTVANYRNSVVWAAHSSIISPAPMKSTRCSAMRGSP